MSTSPAPIPFICFDSHHISRQVSSCTA